jgi:hypothetical protein
MTTTASASLAAHPTAEGARATSGAPTARRDPATPAAPAAAPGAPAAPRLDLYAPIHKALRAAMTETLAQVGRVDVFDAEELAETLVAFEALLDLCAGHIEHENAFVHAAIEARQPAGAERTADDHVEHLASIEALRAEGRRLHAAVEAERTALAQRLYRHLALFVAENFQHMHIEETLNNALLWAHYSDAELAALHDRLVASISPQENLAVARWMVPALSPVERAAMLNGARAGMPPEAFLAIVEHVRPHVDARGWQKLAPAIGVAAQPGRLPA